MMDTGKAKQSPSLAACNTLRRPFKLGAIYLMISRQILPTGRWRALSQRSIARSALQIIVMALTSASATASLAASFAPPKRSICMQMSPTSSSCLYARPGALHEVGQDMPGMLACHS